MSTILGLDLGKFKSVACAYDTTTTVVRFTTVPTDPDDLRELLAAERPGLVVFETCTVAGWVADTCAELGLAYQVANPMHEAWSWRKVKRKTDRDDALKLAKMAAMGELPTVPMPSREARQYRALVKYRDRLVGRRTAIQNHIRAVCQAQGILLPSGHRAWTREGLALVATMAKPLGECGPTEFWRGELGVELADLEQLSGGLEVVEHKLEAIAKEDDRVKLLRTIPGVGRCTAEVVVAHLGDAKRFGTAGQVSSYAGLVPRQSQSGETDRRGRITRRGPGLLQAGAGRGGVVDAAVQSVGVEALFGRIAPQREGASQAGVGGGGEEALARCWAMLKKDRALGH